MHRSYPWLVVLLCACGPKTDDTGDGSGSSSGPGDTSGTGGPPTTSATGTGDPPTTGATTGTDTGSGTGDELCEIPIEPVGPPVEVKITNAGTERTFIDFQRDCFPVQPYQIVGPDEAALELDLGAFKFDCAAGPPGECSIDPSCPVFGRVIQIEPGATFVTSWSGGSFAKFPLSPACAELFCDDCWLEQQAKTGSHRLRVASSATIFDCTDVDCTPCQPDAKGLCVTEGVRIDELIVEAVLDYPAQTSIELVIP